VSGTASAVLTAPPERLMSDLPSRPPRRGDEPAEQVAATDRVKPATDKPEPRFEAARQRLAREEELRARAEAARLAREAGPAERDDEAAADEEPQAPRKGFSFNQTTRRPSGAERNETDRS
jgi:hypothetical protein